MPVKSLREQLREGRLVVAPGVYDGVSALIAGRGDFGALYLSGYAVSASLLGRPDAGYLTLTHLADRARMVCSVSEKPLIADADTGFGGLVQVEEAVRSYECAGAQAIQLEDQEFPKRCGHTKDRRVIDLDEAALKIKVAVESRTSGDFLIVARTDARTRLGLDECFRRTDAFLEAGADILFIESPESPEELRAIAERYPEVWLLANLVDGGRTPLLTADELEELGFSVAIYPLFGLSATVPGLERAYKQLENTGQIPPGAYPFDELNRLVGFERVWDFDRRRKP